MLHLDRCVQYVCEFILTAQIFSNNIIKITW